MIFNIILIFDCSTNEYNDYNLVDISGNIPTFGGSNQVFYVYDTQSTTCITLTTLFPLSYP